MNKLQIIKTDAGEELVVLSVRDYEALRARAGDADAEDLMTARIIAEQRHETALPIEIWEEIEKAPSPIGPLRRWRELTQDQLAKKAKITQPYLSALESGKKSGDVTTLKALAKALEVDLAAVTHDAED